MTLDQLWQNTLNYGALFILAVGAVLFYSGKLVSGDLARHSQEREIASLDQAHKDAMQAYKERFDEMQTTWRERYSEVVKDRDYFRTLATTFAQQSQQSISTAEVLTSAQSPLNSQRQGR